MRIIWKDSNPKQVRPKKYNGYVVDRINAGWITSIPGDDNIYRTRRCALIAIDKFLGKDIGEYLIHVIGKRTDAS